MSRNDPVRGFHWGIRKSLCLTKRRNTLRKKEMECAREYGLYCVIIRRTFFFTFFWFGLSISLCLGLSLALCASVCVSLSVSLSLSLSLALTFSSYHTLVLCHTLALTRVPVYIHTSSDLINVVYHNAHSMQYIGWYTQGTTSACVVNAVYHKRSVSQNLYGVATISRLF